MSAVKNTDQLQAAKILNKIIDTHYCKTQYMPTPSEEQKQILDLKLIKVSQAIADAEYECFEKPRLAVYKRQMEILKSTIKEMREHIKTNASI